MLAVITNSTHSKFLGHTFIIRSMTENEVTLIYSQKDRRTFTATFDDIAIVEIDFTIWEITNRLGYMSYLSEQQRKNWLDCLDAYCKYKNIESFVLTDDNHSMYPPNFNH